MCVLSLSLKDRLHTGHLGVSLPLLGPATANAGPLCAGGISGRRISAEEESGRSIINVSDKESLRGGWAVSGRVVSCDVRGRMGRLTGTLKT